ncbi:hypothetical protein VFPBJ_00121 [Purpureocillium lilacinum]|uniref:Uncharacterized protein n=1 Tax=Purpureocillium lilacinum TaxID=33203 RepID=A0A179H965_PURLI|nr:hypothetical protein VFPBJ_00121 [Purpureocillium lilacinum]
MKECGRRTKGVIWASGSYVYTSIDWERAVRTVNGGIAGGIASNNNTWQIMNSGQTNITGNDLRVMGLIWAVYIVSVEGLNNYRPGLAGQSSSTRYPVGLRPLHERLGDGTRMLLPARRLCGHKLTMTLSCSMIPLMGIRPPLALDTRVYLP